MPHSQNSVVDSQPASHAFSAVSAFHHCRRFVSQHRSQRIEHNIKLHVSSSCDSAPHQSRHVQTSIMHINAGTSRKAAIDSNIIMEVMNMDNLFGVAGGGGNRSRALEGRSSASGSGSGSDRDRFIRSLECRSCECRSCDWKSRSYGLKWGFWGIRRRCGRSAGTRGVAARGSSCRNWLWTCHKDAALQITQLNVAKDLSLCIRILVGLLLQHL